MDNNIKRKGTWGKLLSYFKKYRAFLIAAIVFELFSMLLQIIGPGKLGDMTNEIANGLTGDMDLTLIFQIGILLVFTYLFAGIFGYADAFIMAKMTAKVSEDMRRDVSHKINKIPLDYYDKRSTGDVLSCVTNDVDTISQTLNQSMNSLIRAIILFAGSLFMMLYTSVGLALVAIVCALVGFFLIVLIMSRSQKYFTAQQDELGDLNGYVEEIYTGQTIVKLYNAGKDAKKTFEDLNGKLRVSGVKSQFLSSLMMPIMMFIGNFGYAGVCVVGAKLVLDGSISFGVIVAFMIYIRLFTQPLSTFAQSMQQLQRTSAASKRVFEFLEQEELEDEAHKTAKLENTKGQVEFKNVRFGYSGGKILVQDFSAVAKAGQKVAIVGPTGAGKTTMVNLLMRFYEISGGEICIDGTPLHTVTRENVHDQFCMVLQDTWLFEGTLRENVVYSKTGVSDEAINKSLEAVGLNHFVQTLPQGLDTVLDDKANLSSGQKQLLTIARAMIQDAPLLILDEATSSVDTRTEQLVQAAMDKLTEGRTSFVIAHRLSTIKNSGLILYMKDGDVVERGTHDELMEKNGLYAELYNSQFAQSA